jgi:hypothetical protein
MSKRVFLLGVGLAVVALAFLLTEELLWQPGITGASVRRVRPGMTLQEVKAIFGQGYWLSWHRGIYIVGGPMPWIGVWSGPDGDAIVRFDENDRVESSEFQPNPKTRSNFLSQFHSWVGW